MSRARSPHPVQTVFANLAPVARGETPAWIGRPESHDAGSIPPETAAALLHATSRKVQTSELSASHSAPEQSYEHLPAFLEGAPTAANVPDASFEPPLSEIEVRPETARSWDFELGDLVPVGVPQSENLDDLQAAICSLYRAKAQLLELLTPHVLELVESIVTRLHQSEEFFDSSHCDKDLATRLVREGMRTLRYDGQVAAILGPGFSRFADKLQADLEDDRIQSEIQVHDHLPPYSCHLQSALGSVDESLEARLDKVVAAYLKK